MAVLPQLLPRTDEATQRLGQFIGDVANSPLLQGELVLDVSLVAGELTLRHRLGRRVRGVILVLSDRDITYRVTSNRADRVILNVTSQSNPVPAGGTANFWVF